MLLRFGLLSKGASESSFACFLKMVESSSEVVSSERNRGIGT